MAEPSEATVDLVRVLRDRGVPDAEIAEAERLGLDALRRLAVERLLVPGMPKFSREDVAREVGVELDLARRLWRAMGFPDVPEGVRAFTEVDLEMLRRAVGFLEGGLAGPDLVLQLTRTMGGAMARVAESQVGALRSWGRREEDPSPDVPDAIAAYASAELLELYEEFLIYMWRRHLAAAAERSFLRTEEGSGTELAVGFADLVGFTAVSRELTNDELARVVDRFERETLDAMGAHGGRVVKMIGDEVLFVAQGTAGVARAALDVVDAFRVEDGVPDVRVGLARGEVVGVGGDYFGPTVNLASRLVNVAFPGTVLVDDAVHEELADDDAFAWRHLRSHRLKGIGMVRPWALRRAAGD